MSEYSTTGNNLDITKAIYHTTGMENTSVDAFYDDITEKPYQDLKDRTYFWLGVLSVTIIPLLFGGNFLVLLSLCIFRKLRSVQNLFIGCLASFDLLLSVMALPTYTVDFWFNDILMKYKYLCLFKYASVLFSLTGSLLSLLAIAVDRYIAILHPLQYPLKMTKGKARKVIIVIWTYTITVGIIPYFWHEEEELAKKCDFFEILPRIFVILSTFFVISAVLVVSTGLYIRIFQVATRQKLKMLNMKTRFHPTSRRQLEKDTKSASAMAIVLFFFVAFWFPFMVSGPLKYLDIEENIIEVIKSIAVFLAQSNSGINPFIYCYLKTEFAVAFKLILGRIRGKNKLNADASLSSSSKDRYKSRHIRDDSCLKGEINPVFQTSVRV
ncbi:hypothetical protein FSP39_005103 [Pinctada imbricata]|uniref:G-protein coupled receptors family 1 profile domain-containing protein n=1 Tax=Pinctada imbricata TaxID=66713 RepID=A0AA88XL91_PINIB|nr:hypothetical protein FSP39_005103 [Pinctada imbricata]